MSNKVVISGSYGGFYLSQKACDWLKKRGLDVDLRGNLIDEECKIDPVYHEPIGHDPREYSGIIGNYEKPIERHNPLLVECVETLGEDASVRGGKLKVVEISGNLYRILDTEGGIEILEVPDSINWTIIK